jgi:precorrin-2 dehydrogenase/sirohydrochlorin ferrochelatase
MSLFPIFLKLTGRHCIVVGAGHLAESKIASLRAADDAVNVNAPQVTEATHEQAAPGEITLHQRAQKHGDLQEPSRRSRHQRPAVNRAVFAGPPPPASSATPSTTALLRLLLPSSAAETCNRHLHRGNSPALAQQLRKELNEQLPLDLGDWLADLGDLRREVVAAEPLNEQRRLLLHELAQRQVCSYDQCPSRLLAREHALTNPFPTEKA